MHLFNEEWKTSAKRVAKDLQQSSEFVEAVEETDSVVTKRSDLLGKLLEADRYNNYSNNDVDIAGQALDNDRDIVDSSLEVVQEGKDLRGTYSGEGKAYFSKVKKWFKDLLKPAKN